jgi:hypothetical protein
MDCRVAAIVAICAALLAVCSASSTATAATISTALKQSGPQAFAYNPTLSSNGTQVREWWPSPLVHFNEIA